MFVEIRCAVRVYESRWRSWAACSRCPNLRSFPKRKSKLSPKSRKLSEILTFGWKSWRTIKRSGSARRMPSKSTKLGFPTLVVRFVVKRHCRINYTNASLEIHKKFIRHCKWVWMKWLFASSSGMFHHTSPSDLRLHFINRSNKMKAKKLTSRWTIFVRVNLAIRFVKSEFLRMISETVAETVFAAMKKTKLWQKFIWIRRKNALARSRWFSRFSISALRHTVQKEQDYRWCSNTLFSFLKDFQAFLSYQPMISWACLLCMMTSENTR